MLLTLVALGGCPAIPPSEFFEIADQFVCTNDSDCCYIADPCSVSAFSLDKSQIDRANGVLRNPLNNGIEFCVKAIPANLVPLCRNNTCVLLQVPEENLDQLEQFDAVQCFTDRVQITEEIPENLPNTTVNPEDRR